VGVMCQEDLHFSVSVMINQTKTF